ncbi:MAG: TRAP transporter substrate-binding protein [Burkholderiales bacterium]
MKTLIACSATVALLCAGAAVSTVAQDVITLHGAVQFNDEHAYNKTLLKFEELTRKYYGKPINFVLHRNSELGLEKDYFVYMNQGRGVDYAVVSPAHMSTFSRSAPFIDAPFLFRDHDHWRKVIDADIFKPIAEEVARKADVLLIGYAGGGVRNVFASKPLPSLDAMKGVKLRVMGAPVWSRAFAAVGMAPSVIAYNEVYNAIQNGVILAGDNEAAGIEQMKFYEVAPHVSLTQHSYTIRPVCFSGKTFKALPPALQAAVLKAGREAGAYGRDLEAREDVAKLEKMEKAGKLKRIAFPDRAQMQSRVAPVLEAYAKEIGAEEILAKINAIR